MIKRITFSIDEEIIENFKETCKDNYLNQSAIIAAKLKEVVEQYKKGDVNGKN